MQNAMPILLLEDSEIDVELVERVFKKSNIRNPLYKAEDGTLALEMLSGDNDNKIPQPCVILIDINLPRMDGFTFLERLRGDKALSRNVAFMLTTSNRQEDIDRAYGLNVAGYILKDDIRKLGDMLENYLDISKFPAGEDIANNNILKSF